MKYFYALFLLMFVTTSTIAQFFETVGSPSSTSPVNFYTGWAEQTPMYLGTTEIQAENPSYSDYYFFTSGAGNIFFTSTPGTFFQISHIPSAMEPAYASISFFLTGYDTSNEDNLSELALTISYDSGATWQNVPYYRIFKQNWSPQPWDIFGAGFDEVSDFGKLMIRFTQTTSTKTFRIDDIKFNSVILLPIKLNYFTSTLQSNKAVLNWEASTSANNESFIVEKSLNGITFSPIQKIMAKGNGEFTYDFTDEPLTKTLYRLKMITIDGKNFYSGITSVNPLSQLAPAIFPNPAKDKLHIKFNTNSAQQVQLYITDVKGQQRLKQVITSNEGLNTYDLNISALQAGIYYLTVITSDNRFTKKFVVSR